MTTKRTISLIDVTLRDAHQCLWATRMTTAAMADIAPRLDRAGFEAIDLVGGAVFDVCVRYLREDPWERMRILSGWVRETPLIVHHRGQSLFTFELFPDDVVELTAERIAASGIRYHTTYDALNDVRNLEVPVRAAKAAGLHTVAGFVYTVSPVHTDAYYAGKVREMVALGADGIFLKDPSGLLTPERAATLVPAAKRACGSLPLQIHSHCLSGLAPYVVVKCVEHGADAVHTATSTLANGASHPSTEQFARNVRRAGFDVEVDLDVVEDVADRLRFIAANEGKPVGEIAPYDEFHYHHQVPGGMISNLKSQLAPLGIEHRLEEILDEAGRVRADLGYPIVVSPFAQFIITQSVLNVMNEERYASVPDEVRKYVLGYYGEIAGPIDPNLFDRITGGAEPVRERPGLLAPPALARLRSSRGPFASDDDLLLAAYYDDREYGALKAAGPIGDRISNRRDPVAEPGQGAGAPSRPELGAAHAARLTHRSRNRRRSRAMTRVLGVLARRIADALRDLAPIILVIAFFQIVVLQQPFPNLGSILVGLLCVVAGLTLFIQGLESGLFPLGEAIAEAFARKGSAVALLGFAFCLGFGTTVAEPALIAVAAKAAEVASQAGAIADDEQARADYAFELRMVVAFSVGAAIVLGVLRILKGWPIHRLIIGGYVLVTIMTVFAPDEIIGVAYDSGGVTTSTITVPLVTALGVGLATSIKGRNPMIDGFGLIAFASLTPMIFVLVYGMVA